MVVEGPERESFAVALSKEVEEGEVRLTLAGEEVRLALARVSGEGSVSIS